MLVKPLGSAIADGFKITANDPHSGITPTLSNQYARAVATQIAPLLYRTQGLQVYRDGLHSLCIDKMNGWLGGHDKETTYITEKRYLMDEAIKLIQAEFKIMETVQAALKQNAKAGTGINAPQALADGEKSSSTTKTNPEPVPPSPEKSQPIMPPQP